MNIPPKVVYFWWIFRYVNIFEWVFLEWRIFISPKISFLIFCWEIVICHFCFKLLFLPQRHYRSQTSLGYLIV